MLFPTTIAGSLAEAGLAGRTQHAVGALEIQRRRVGPRQARRHPAAVKLQEDAGSISSPRANSRASTSSMAFLEQIEGIDFAHKVEMGIRNDRYKAMVAAGGGAAAAEGPRPCPRGGIARTTPPAS